MNRGTTVGLLIAIALVAALFAIQFKDDILSWIQYVVNFTITWKFVHTKDLRVDKKVHVPTGVIVENYEIQVAPGAPIARLQRTYPATEMWVIFTSIRIGVVRVSNLPIAIDQTAYDKLKPSDHFANPHFGKFNPESWVDPRIVLWDSSRPQ